MVIVWSDHAIGYSNGLYLKNVFPQQLRIGYHGVELNSYEVAIIQLKPDTYLLYRNNNQKV
ncbi:hypothetical protein DSBG_4491 [Desulfosporosinus sp. BG]|nr:hypothetical protein DSBG_4491 [Desulfosporosinus sp. BG]